MSTSLPATRPVGVTIVGVIGIIQGILAILGGLALAIENNSTSLIDHVNRSSGTILGLGIGLIIVGAITLLVAWALLRGSNFARWLIGIIEIFHLASGVIMLFGYDGTYRWNGVWSIIIAAIVLYFLFSSRAEDFFRGRAV